MAKSKSIIKLTETHTETGTNLKSKREVIAMFEVCIKTTLKDFQVVKNPQDVSTEELIELLKKSLPKKESKCKD